MKLPDLTPDNYPRLGDPHDPAIDRIKADMDALDELTDAAKTAQAKRDQQNIDALSRDFSAMTGLDIGKAIRGGQWRKLGDFIERNGNSLYRVCGGNAITREELLMLYREIDAELACTRCGRVDESVMDGFCPSCLRLDEQERHDELLATEPSLRRGERGSDE